MKGAFLNADAAYEVLQGIRTLDVRMLAKCINTIVWRGSSPRTRT